MCNNFCVVHLFYSDLRRYSNDSLIASPRRHIDIHRKWVHEIMVVLGNTAAMETRRYNCSKQYAVSYTPVNIIVSVLLISWEENCRNSSAADPSANPVTLYRICPTVPVVRCHQIPQRVSIHLCKHHFHHHWIWPEHFYECHLNFQKLPLSFVNIQLQADIYLCLLSIFPYCLAPFRHFRDLPHFMYLHLF